MASPALLRRLAALVLLLLLATPAWAQWINELHYDNDGVDVGEAVEVVLPSAADPADFELYLYNGSNGEPYGGSPYDLATFAAGDTEGGFTVYSLEISPIQNGAPDGLALVEDGVLVPGQFLSYEGTFEGVGGPADGVTSTDIGVAEGSDTPIGHSLQLTGTGTTYDEFSWTGPLEDSFGSVNAGQSLSGATVPTVSFASPNSQTVTEGTDEEVLIEVQIFNAGSESVSVDVVLTGGEADSGDFDGVTMQTVTFPAEAPDGSTQTATFPLTNDEDDEGTETAIFELQNLVSDDPDATIGSPSTYTLTIEDDDAVLPDLVINEIYANPTTDPANDANNDGLGDTFDDEFVEIVNIGEEPIDLSGYWIEDSQGSGTNRVKHIFPEGTRLDSSQAIVVFGGGDPQGDFGGALVQVATSGGLDLANAGETVTLFDADETVIVSYTYAATGSTNRSSWTRNPDLTGGFVRHNSTIDGALFSPGTQVDGTPFGGGDAGAIVTVLKGDAGWRMLAAPVGDLTVGDLAAQNLVQGITGQYPDADPNIRVTYDGTSFVVPADEDAALEPGKGFIWYLFDVRHDPNRPDGDSESFPLPFTLEASGSENDGPVVVTLNDIADGNGEKWDLLGNPFDEAIDVELIEPDGENGLVSKVGQVWDPNPGSYVLTTDVAPTAESGNELAVWQGAFFQNDDATEVTIPTSAKLGVGSGFYGRPGGGGVTRGQIGFSLAGLDGQSGQTTLDRAVVLYLDAEASDGWDLRDATKLTPIRGTYATLAFVGERAGSEVLKAQESRPFEGASFDVPLVFEAVGISGTFTLQWLRWTGVPEDWAITLTDTETGAVVDLRADTSYTFAAQAGRAAEREERLAAPTVRSLQRSTDPRFTLSVARSATDAEGGAAPAAFALEGAYPNPFSTTATVRYALPHAAEVRVAVYDVLGREVARLVEGPREAGRHTATVSSSGLAGGVYFVRMTADGFAETKKVVVIK